MLWAIDVGNTQTVVGIHDGWKWVAEWRLTTDLARTEDELAAHLLPLLQSSGLEPKATGVIVGSVVPPVDQTWIWFAKKYLGQPVHFVKTGAEIGLSVDYNPPTAVGADRIANALGALLEFKPPIIVVDFGTATTLDCIDESGTYVGGAILPGILVSRDSLVGKTAKLPAIGLEAPENVIGKTTVESLQSGIVLGYIGAIDTLVERASAELGGDVTVVSTGGLGTIFQPLCKTIQSHSEELTLNGLKEAFSRLTHR